ncbi:MAG: response regulator [Candidatus Brocadiia bacterium]
MTEAHGRKEFAILYVDDEQQALKYFSKAFEKDFTILTAPNAAEAWDLLEENAADIGIVVADQRMPNETGVELLSKVRHSWPTIVRMLTTAYSDLDSAIEAVNSGEVFRYVVKPWDLRELRGDLLRAMEFFLVQRERNILLREKLSTLERMMATDRIRSMTIMATALSSRLRAPLSALDAFLDAVGPVRRVGIPGGADDLQAFQAVDSWSLAKQDSRFQRHLVERVLNRVAEPPEVFSETVALPELLAPAVQKAKEAAEAHDGTVNVNIDGQLPDLTVDRPIAEGLFELLFDCAEVVSQGNQIDVSAEQADVSGRPGVRVEVTARGAGSMARQGDLLGELFAEPGDCNGKQGANLLSAYLFAYHHGGSLEIEIDGEDRVTFELLLPCDPREVDREPPSEDRLTELFGLAEAWERQDQRGPE